MTKNLTLAFICISIIATLASCTKKGPAENPSSIGSWSFKGKTYSEAQGYVYMNGELVGASHGPGSTVLISFYNTVPTTGGTYDVVDNELANQIHIEFDDSTSGNAYQSYNYNHAIQPATVAVSSTGKLSVTGSNITLYNQNNLADSASFTLNVVQQ